MTPKTDIIIAVRSTRKYPLEKYFETCLDSIVRYTSNYRFIFVDDASDDIGAAAVSNAAARFHDSVLIRTHKQNWFTRAHNKALRLVKTPCAVMINADCGVGEGWLEELYECWTQTESLHGQVGLVGSQSYDTVNPKWVLAVPGVHPGYVTGHCWLVSIKAMFDVSVARGTNGWYLNETNPALLHIRSDVEMCTDMNKCGYKTVMSFHANVQHYGGRSWGHDLSSIDCLRLEDLPD